ncbi:MATE family efflux transporter [Opitutaceae bacterium]|nr:MATE family efflux transporter [Opitutaceae bacterium]
MNPLSQSHETTYRAIAGRVWPIVVANAATPLLGLADTAVIGRTGEVAALGAIALGSLVFSFVYWTFGFLRMGTTGLVAQAVGSEDESEVRAIVGRSVLMGMSIGVILLTIQIPVFRLALHLLKGGQEVETLSSVYLGTRIWGAPAALALYAVMGALVGLGRSRTLLWVQVALNSISIGLDVLLAGYFGMGVVGIGIGTAISEWVAALLALYLVVRILKQRHRNEGVFWSWSRILDLPQLTRMLVVNGNIMIRTFCLLIGFGWFTQQGARLGEVTLAANHILLQFVSFSAFFLDGVAFATEALVGVAAGARRISVFNLLVRRTTIMAGVIALILALGSILFGPAMIGVLTDHEAVRNAARSLLPYASLYILLSFVAFQLDGIYIGVTRSRDMRNASFASLIAFLAIGYPLTGAYDVTGLWISFIVFIVARAVSLGALYPRLKRSVGGSA